MIRCELLSLQRVITILNRLTTKTKLRYRRMNHKGRYIYMKMKIYVYIYENVKGQEDEGINK